MAVYMVGIRLEAKDGDEVIARIEDWGLSEDEGVMSIQAQPEMVIVPQELQPAPPPGAFAPPQPSPEPTNGKSEKAEKK